MSQVSRPAVTAVLPMAVRRGIYSTLIGTTMAGMIWLAAAALAPGGLTAVDIAILLLLVLWLPWFVIGFWNSTIGFILMRFTADPIAAVTPQVRLIRGDEPITTSTAILICIRNEIPTRVARNLTPLLDDLVASGEGSRFHLYVLSDTSDKTVAAAEAALFEEMSAKWQGRIAITYRLREINTGFKAGNVREFCERWGANHDFAITLDADSIITAPASLRMVRIMQADPKLGILQALVVGLPSASAFARMFQFGMRLGMRSFTIGSAWWQGDCGPYWGHNAIIRLKPFIEHCELPVLSGHGLLGGHILSHDQIEAVLMRRAGFDVRVLAEENLGWEENPPTMTEFIRRDVRWCQGNMQYLRLVGMPGIRPVSRFQIAFAILMYFVWPIWIVFIGLTALSAAFGGMLIPMRADLGITLFVIGFVMMFAPKIATGIDVLLTPKLRATFGGTARFVTSFMVEMVFSILLLPIVSFVHTVFVSRLLTGRSISWMAQSRDTHEIPLVEAVSQYWPHTVAGLLVIGTIAWQAPALLPYALFAALGLAVAIPFAVATASLAIGAWCVRHGICQLPEERQPPPMLKALRLPVIEANAARPELSSAASHAR
jgi:membrane glycosyltransferase